ncbi:MBL fold metallo-hydrolase [Roseobacter sp. HKCCD8198]|uniref:MBL fold metallo-hydrolase n=1 Tax=unclassified Roseobacter TaxID=196798 RepID=UPI00346125C0
MIHYPYDTAPEPGAAIELADGVLWIRLPLPMALDHVNVFALRDGAGWALVDTGFDSRRSRAIWAEILAAPLGGDPITKVIATHHHPDHIGLAGWFMGQGAELITTRTAWLMARMLILDEQARPTEETLDFWRAAGMAPDILAKRAAERPFNFADMVHPLPLGYTRIAEGDVIQIGGRHWHIRIGHGHAPEHATLWSVEDNLVLGGDQLLPSISPNLGVYATEPAADPVHDWLESCEAFQPFAAEDHFVLPGHKLPYTGLPDRLRQLIDNHHGALDRLREHLGTPRTAAECFAPLFKRKIEEGTYGLALVESLAHLNHLLALGEVTREKRADGAWVWQREN